MKQKLITLAAALILALNLTANVRAEASEYGYHVYSHGLKAVLVDGAWNYIDSTGKVVDLNRGRFKYVFDFSDGLAAVIDLSDKTGYIDTSGALVIPCKYGVRRESDGGVSVGLFHDGKAPVYKEVYEARPDVPMEYVGVIDKTGNLITDYRHIGFMTEEELAPLYFCWDTGTPAGIVDNTGKNPENPPDIPKPSEPEKLAYPYEGKIIIDGTEHTVRMYQLRGEDGKGAGTNYVRVRDLAALLKGTEGQFNVTSKNRRVVMTGRTPYDGKTDAAPFTGNEKYTVYDDVVIVDGIEVKLDAFQLHDASGGGYTYFRLRELGKALGFNVTNKGKTPVIETDKQYIEL